jgi:hypothetical protein
MSTYPIVRLAGNPLQCFGFRPKIVDMLSDAIGPLGFNSPIAPDLVGYWLERRFRIFADLCASRLIPYRSPALGRVLINWRRLPHS